MTTSPACGPRTRCTLNELETSGRYWSVTKYDDVRAVDGDWETFSSARGITLGLRPSPEVDAQFSA